MDTKQIKTIRATVKALRDRADKLEALLAVADKVMLGQGDYDDLTLLTDDQLADIRNFGPNVASASERRSVRERAGREINRRRLAKPVQDSGLSLGD